MRRRGYPAASCGVRSTPSHFRPGFRQSEQGVGQSRRSRSRLDVIGLFLIFAGTAGLALWQASNHLTPTIFTDELEMATLSRSIAETGHGILRDQVVDWRSVPLGAYLSAPFWWIDDVPTAYAWVKALGAIMMASVVFPAYGLARLAVRPGWALFAAAGTGIAPALAYAPILVKEPAAYPAATLALFLIARWAAAPGWRRLVLALARASSGTSRRTSSPSSSPPWP